MVAAQAEEAKSKAKENVEQTTHVATQVLYI